MVTILGWLRAEAASASRRNRTKSTESSPTCSGRIFNATKRCRRVSSALKILRSEEHTSELQSRLHLVCRLLLEKKKTDRIVQVLVLLLTSVDPHHTDQFIPIAFYGAPALNRRRPLVLQLLAHTLLHVATHTLLH